MLFYCLVAKSCPTLKTPWAVAHQLPLSMGYSGEEYWNGLPFPSLGDLPDPGIEPWSPSWAGRFLTAAPPGKPIWILCVHTHTHIYIYIWMFPGDSDSKESACNAGEQGLIPGSGRFHGEGNGNPLQYSCLEDSMYRGAWWATVHKESDMTEWRPPTTHTHAYICINNIYSLPGPKCFCSPNACILSHESGWEWVGAAGGKSKEQFLKWDHLN